MKKLKSEDKGLFRNVCTSQVGMGITMTMIGSVLPQIAGEYGLDYSFSGLLLSVQSAGYFIAGLAAGYLPRYFGARKCYVGLGVMAFIGLWLLMHTSQPFLLLLAMLLTGISKGSGNNFTNQFTANISQGDTGRLNFMHAFYPVGACIAPLLVMACGVSWRTAFRIVIVFGVLYLLHAMVMRVSPRASGSAAIQTGKNDYSFFKLEMFWVCAGLMSAYVAFESALSGWLVTYFRKRHHDQRKCGTAADNGPVDLAVLRTHDRGTDIEPVPAVSDAAGHGHRHTSVLHRAAAGGKHGRNGGRHHRHRPLHGEHLRHLDGQQRRHVREIPAVHGRSGRSAWCILAAGAGCYGCARRLHGYPHRHGFAVRAAGADIYAGRMECRIPPF